MGIVPYQFRYLPSQPKNHTIPMDYEVDVRKINLADLSNSIGLKLSLFRMNKGLDQQAVAEICGLSKCRLSEYENAQRIPSIATLIALANFYECTVEDLLGRNLVRVKEKKK